MLNCTEKKKPLSSYWKAYVIKIKYSNINEKVFLTDHQKKKKARMQTNEKKLKDDLTTSEIVSSQVRKKEEATVFYSFLRKVIQQERSRLPTQTIETRKIVS